MIHGADLVVFIDKGRGMKSNDSRIGKTIWYLYFTITIWKKEEVGLLFFFERYEFDIQSTPVMHCKFQNYKFTDVIPA